MLNTPFRRLTTIADMKRDIELARLSQSVRLHNDIVSERERLLALLEKTMAQRMGTLQDAKSADRFRIFTQTRDAALSQAQSQIGSELTTQKLHAAKAFGRAQALAKLLKQSR